MCPFVCPCRGPRLSCQTYNIVYVTHCTKCTKLYIRETGHTLNTHFKEHLADIKYHKDKPVANHFTQAGHSIHSVMLRDCGSYSLTMSETGRTQSIT